MKPLLHHKIARVLPWPLALSFAATVTCHSFAENPYQQIIVERNVFGLKDPPPPPSATPEAPPPPKIQLVGIANVLGVRKAVLRPLPAPGTPPKPGVPGQPAVAPGNEPPIVLREGDALDGIEVLAIDEIGGSVKVNNNGQALTLTFADNGAKAPTGAAAPAAPVPGAPGMPGAPGGVPGFPAGVRPGFPGAGGAGGAAGVVPMAGTMPGTPGGVGITGAPATSSGITPTLPERQVRALSPEETAVLYEVNRERNKVLSEAGLLPRMPSHPAFTTPGAQGGTAVPNQPRLPGR